MVVTHRQHCTILKYFRMLNLNLNINGAKKGLPYPLKDLTVQLTMQTYEDDGTTYYVNLHGHDIPVVAQDGGEDILDFSVLEDDRFNKGAVVGNSEGFPEYWDSPWNAYFYYDDTSAATLYHWKIKDFHYAMLQVQADRSVLQDVFFLKSKGTETELVDSATGLYIYENAQTGNNLAKILNHCGIYYYGTVLDESISDPDMERIGRMSYHASLPSHQTKACLQNLDGSINYYLNPDDWSKKADGTASNLDGTDGNVMIEVDEYYRKTENLSTGLYLKLLSKNQIDGFQKIDKFYIGAYKAAVNRTGTIKLWSVQNTDAEYRGGNNDDTLDGTDATQLGKPAISISLINSRSYARNIVTDEYKWNVITWKHAILLYELFFIEYATLNSQKAVVTELTVEGYKQGGLGNGTTTVNSTDWGNFNSDYPLVPCGTSNGLGNASGEVDYTINNFGGEGVDEVIKVNRYRGVENPFGDIWEWCDGASVNHGAETSDFYTCETPANFDDETENNYTKRSELPTSK